MAGEIEESFSVQLGSLHSGSISFGRFESDESLSWERRSSFSHNRYLEEVEKYSTPGSVTQKKAYFEAHFKKKALLCQSSEFQNGMEYQTSSNDILEDMSYIDEFVQLNKDSYLANNEKTTDGLDDQEECELLDYERESEEIAPSDFHMESPVFDAYEVADGDLHCSEPGDPQQIQLEHDAIVLDKEKSEVELKHKLLDEAENMDGNDPSPKHQNSGKEHALSMKKSKKPSPKESDRAQMKTGKPKARTEATAPVQRKMSTETSKDSAKNPRRTERESMLKTRNEKQLRQKALPITTSVPGSVKPEDPKSLKVKSSQENKSEKDERGKRAGALPVPQHSASDMGELRSCQTVNRPKQSASSNKAADAKSTNAVFSFRSDERAEKRKEFYMKLEEKMHAKEAEMNQIQARTQEETEAEIKQLRRTLNFKATPMPSFYHEAVPRGSDGKKVISAHAKSTNSQSKTTSSGSRPMRSPAFPKPGTQQELSVTESANTTKQSKDSESTNSNTMVPSECDNCAPTTKSRSPSASKRIETAAKKEKGKNADTQKQRGSAVGKGERGDMMKKMKGLGIGGSSGMGSHLSVDVAS